MKKTKLKVWYFIVLAIVVFSMYRYSESRAAYGRTAAVVNGALGAYGSTIQIDYNGDGSLECFAYDSYYGNWNAGKSVAIGTTPEGYGIYNYITNKIIVNYGNKFIYAKAIPSLCPSSSVCTTSTRANYFMGCTVKDNQPALNTVKTTVETWSHYYGNSYKLNLSRIETGAISEATSVFSNARTLAVEPASMLSLLFVSTCTPQNYMVAYIFDITGGTCNDLFVESNINYTIKDNLIVYEPTTNDEVGLVFCMPQSTRVVIVQSANSQNTRIYDYQYFAKKYISTFFSCGGTCQPSWSCTEWGQCMGNVQTRVCTDKANCGVADGKPTEQRTCSTQCPPVYPCPSCPEPRCPPVQTCPVNSTTGCQAPSYCSSGPITDEQFPALVKRWINQQ